MTKSKPVEKYGIEKFEVAERFPAFLSCIYKVHLPRAAGAQIPNSHFLCQWLCTLRCSCSSCASAWRCPQWSLQCPEVQGEISEHSTHERRFLSTALVPTLADVLQATLLWFFGAHCPLSIFSTSQAEAALRGGLKIPISDKQICQRAEILLRSG